VALGAHVHQLDLHARVAQPVGDPAGLARRQGTGPGAEPPGTVRHARAVGGPGHGRTSRLAEREDDGDPAGSDASVIGATVTSGGAVRTAAGSAGSRSNSSRSA